jgi:uncharacterized protein (TIGR03437 family)
MKTGKRWNKSRLLGGAMALWLCAPALGASYGKVVPIGGHASDLALDESRKVLYIANFTANRIDVMSLGDYSIQSSFNVAPLPGSIALSPDGRYLVVAHFGNFQSPNTPTNALSVLDLNTRGRQTFALGNPPLGVAFGIDGLALVVTTSEFLLFDPATGVTRLLDTIAGVTAKALPVPLANFPANVVASSLAATRDGMKIYGMTAAGSDAQTLEFVYEVALKRVTAQGWVSSPPLGPRVVSVSDDGSLYMAGWALNDSMGSLVAQFPNPSGILNIGSHAIDSRRGLIYAQFTSAAQAAPTTPGGSTGGTGTTTSQPAAEPAILNVMDMENLAVLDRLSLAENLSGKSVISADNATMYSISDSGVTVFPIGSLDRERRVAATAEDLVFRSNFCDRRMMSQQVTIYDVGGNRTDFTLSSSNRAVSVSPTSGVTPATVTVQVDPTSFANQKGTTVAQIQVKSSQSVNIPSPIRVLVNTKEPDQRGTIVNVPGKLVDILADPMRDRFFVLRQDKNQVLVFDGTTYQQIAVLKTGSTPTQLAVSFDRKYLLIGNDNSQIVNVYDLESLQPSQYIRMPGGHYPRSIASSGKAMLVANRVAGPTHVIDSVDFASRTATQLPTLGAYKNEININTTLVASTNGSSIMAAMADGNVLLYNANVDTFTISRKDFTALSGAYAASNLDWFVVGNNLLNSSLVKVRELESGNGSPSGFAFVDQGAMRTSAQNQSSPGVIQKLDLTTGTGAKSTRMVEAPLLINDVGLTFTRTLAPLFSRKSIVSLTTSGFVVLPWDYDAAAVAPKIDRVVNAADYTKPVAPGGLVAVFGSNLSPISQASSEMPLPRALGESCLTVNGVSVPMIYVSNTQINAQLPFQVDGNTTMILRTVGGVSDNYNLQILTAAPSIFRNGTTGPETGIPAVLRLKNAQLVTPSNPIRYDDTIIIYLTGMGDTNPVIEAGNPAPNDPPPTVIIPVNVELAGVELEVLFAGLTPGQVGVYEIHAYVPRGVPEGMFKTLKVSQAGSETTVIVRVVE